MTDHIQETLAILQRKYAEIGTAIDALRTLQGEAARVQAFIAEPTKAPRRQAKKPRAKPGPKPKLRAVPDAGPERAVAAAPGSGPAKSETAVARDRAIVRALAAHGGDVELEELMIALPKEPGQTEQQRATALRNCLTRLRMKGEIEQSARGAWKLRKRA